MSEFGLILKEDYGIKLKEKELEDAANSIVGYFYLLGKMAQEQKFESYQRLLEKGDKGGYD